MEEIKSKVNIRKDKLGRGYFIEIEDETGWSQEIAVTKNELEQIILYGQLILK